MHCHGVGRFVDNPEIKNIDNTRKVCQFRLCFVEVIKGEDGDKKEYHYLPCIVWDTAAEYIANNFKSGDPIEVVDATARRDIWKTATGEKRSKIIFRINKFSKI